ncbi:MAG TPA: TIGR04255 family protein [Williamwhitmania sp.]|nr:TIGR04255 family protein [Williamwhitmania sp.]
MTTTLPKKLKKEPLIDAIFEMRFDSVSPVLLILPGILFRELGGEKTIEALPIAQLPPEIRRADPNLKYSPLHRLDWGLFFVNIGDFSLSVSCKYPYPGWNAFKPAIIEVMRVLLESKLTKTIERYSLKYIDVIPFSDHRLSVSMVNLEVMIAGHKLEKEPFSIQVEIPKNGMKNIVQIVSSAKATLYTGVIKEGLVVDVDTVANQNGVSMNALFDRFPDLLDAIHQTNKEVFFDCITKPTLNSLEPVYE